VVSPGFFGSEDVVPLCCVDVVSSGFILDRSAGGGEEDWSGLLDKVASLSKSCVVPSLVSVVVASFNRRRLSSSSWSVHRDRSSKADKSLLLLSISRNRSRHTSISSILKVPSA